MTITMANEVNRIVDRILLNPKHFESVEDDILDLVMHAHKALAAGHTAHSFRFAMGKALRKYCAKCAGTGKIDRGNGSTKPCDCAAGLIEGTRRKDTRATKRKARA